LLAASGKKLRSGDVVALFFNRRDSQRAARALLAWLKERGGKCTKAEMSRFAFGLEAGEPCKFSRTNFYGGVLRRFLDLGLIAEQPGFDEGRRKAIKLYRVVWQPIPQHRPMGPSFYFVAHLICEAWNREFAAT
jgi:hypothetical protein